MRIHILAALILCLLPLKALAGGGATLYYQQGTEIWRTQADGTPPQRVATLAEPADRFWFSPDGTSLFASGYSSQATGTNTWVVSTSTLDQRPTPLFGYHRAEPSPDGKWLAAVLKQGEDEVLTILSVGGGGSRAVTPAYPPSKPYPTRFSWFGWSADGRYLAYTVMEDGFPWGWGRNLYTVRTDGTRLTWVGAPGRGTTVAWAPRGDRLAWLEQDRERGVLFTARPNGTGRVQLSGNAGSLYFSPDGRYLLFAEEQSLYRVAPDGTRRSELLRPTYSAYPAAWAPKGDRVAVVDGHSWEEEYTLHLLPMDGGRAPAQSLKGTDPVWSPDGQSLFYRDGDSYRVYPPVGGARLPVAGDLFGAPHWSPDGSGLALPTREALTIINLRTLETVAVAPGESAVIGWRPLPLHARPGAQGLLWLLPFALLLLKWTRPVTKKGQKVEGG